MPNQLSNTEQEPRSTELPPGGGSKNGRGLALKLAGAFTAAILPFFVVLFYMVVERGADIEFAQKEVSGSKLVVLLDHLGDDIARARGMDRVSRIGGRVDASSLSKVRAEISGHFRLWRVLLPETGFAPQLAPKMERIRAKWAALADKRQLSIEESFTAHTEIVNDLHALNLDIANVSNLILDPVLPSYYLMDLVVKTLPSFSETVGLWRGLTSPKMVAGGHAAGAKPGSHGGDDHALHQLWIIHDLFLNIKYAHGIVSRERPDIGAKLLPAFERLRKRHGVFDTFVKNRNAGTVEPDAIFRQASLLIDAASAFGDASGEALGDVLNGRIDELQFALWRTIALAVFAACVTAFVWWVVLRAITTPLRAEVERRRTAEREVVAHRDHLAELVEEKTTDLRNQTAQLAEALDAERKLNELQQEFVSMASHEFRTPLAIIDGAAQRIVRRKDRMTPDELEERVGKIRSAVKRMTGLVERTLDASRFNAGKVELEIGDLDLKGLVAAVCARQQEISTGHRINIDLNRLPEGISGDRKLLDQVFTNLLSNAVKYSRDDPTVAVEGFTEGADAVIRVRDNGVGIPADELPRLFERYFRASTSIGIPGTGIGLNLVKQLVELHGGSIVLESEEGIGSTFTVRLPVNMEGSRPVLLAKASGQVEHNVPEAAA